MGAGEVVDDVDVTTHGAQADLDLGLSVLLCRRSWLRTEQTALTGQVSPPACVEQHSQLSVGGIDRRQRYGGVGGVRAAGSIAQLVLE